MILAKPFRLIARASTILLLLVMSFAAAEYVVIPKGEGLNCQRIVSVSPALSDMMSELKIDDRIVGATRYCKLPFSKSREIVGGYFDLNFEKVVSLKPDIVFLEGTINNPISQKLDSLGIKNRVFSLDTLDEMEAAKQEIGHYCEGQVVIGGKTLRDHLASFISKDRKDSVKPRVLILYNYGDNAVKILPRLAAGRSFHGELLDALAMENVYLGSLNAPELTREAISLLNPEWIFILNGLVGDQTIGRDALDVEQIQPKWEFLSTVDAVQNNHVYEIKGFYTQIPSVTAMRRLGSIFAELVYSDDDSSAVLSQ